MSGSVEVEPDPIHAGGHAIIRVRGAGTFRGRSDFRIRRDDYDDGVFGPNGWQVADAALQPDAQAVDGNDLLLHIGPSVVQHMPSGVYRFALPAAGVDTTMFWPDLPLLADEALNIIAEPARAAGRVGGAVRPQILRPDGTPKPAMHDMASGQPGPSGGAAAKEAATVHVVPPAVEEPAPPPQSRRWLYCALLACLVVAAGGGYFAYRTLNPSPPASVAEQGPPVTQPAPPNSAPPNSVQLSPSPPPRPAAPDLRHMSAAEALHSGASPAALLDEAQRRMQLDSAQRSEALLLMQGAADPDRNFAPAHAALARLYDPSLPRPPEIQPDARQAALHYRSAVRGGENAVADERAALRAYLERRQGQGDLYAPLILKEFWP